MTFVTFLKIFFKLESSRSDVGAQLNDIDKGKQKESEPESSEEGIRRFKIIGSKKFFHNDEELDNHLAHVLKWWRGERKPEGVSLDHTHRCS